MNLRDLKYLVALADYGHFGKAAEFCCVSQPALSMQIKKLEDNFGVSLIERTKKTFLLTPIGKTIAECARALLNQANEIKELAKQAQDPFSGELKLGMIPTVGPYLLPYIMSDLSKAFPQITFYLVEEKTELLVEKMQQGFLDAALLSLTMQSTNFSSMPLYQEEFKLAVARHHPLAEKSMLRVSDLKDLSLLLLEEGHCLRNEALEFCYKTKNMKEKSFRATSLETLRHMVAANAGMTLMPSLACKSNDGITYLSLPSVKAQRNIAMFWRMSSAKNLLLTSMVQQIKKSLSSLEIIKILE